MQSMGRIPVDFETGAWDITQQALKAGILIVAAAGNGGKDLDYDGEGYEEYRNRPDNGIIRVGAGSELLARASFSTYGSMIHLQGRGTWNVVTTGYGDLYDGGPNNNYSGLLVPHPLLLLLSLQCSPLV